MDHAKLVVIRMEEARDSRGISVAELARRASIDRKRLWYILDGQRQMRADEFVRLCAVMGLDMGFFLTNDMKEELAYRRQKVIEDYGTGLCGLVPPKEERRRVLRSLGTQSADNACKAALACAASLRAASNLSIAPSPLPQPIGSNHLIR